jgi:two-component sensor histidine kinase
MVYERDVDGNVTSIVGAAHEISERKAREEQVQLLMREVNHRAKNLLGVVQVIARQTAATDAQSFAERFGERVMALAASQDLLVENEWRGVDLGDLVRSQREHMADLVGERIKLDGPPLRVSAAAAQNIGMTLHELATNAGKYGALSCPNGRVEVAWRLAGTPPDDRLTIGWIERGGPPVAPPGRRGFGSTVIDEMVRRSLDAEVSFTLGPDGAEWHMDCPAANALEVAHPPEPVNPRVDPGSTDDGVRAGSNARRRENHNQLWKTVAS